MHWRRLVKVFSTTFNMNAYLPKVEGFGLGVQSDGSYPYAYSEGLNFTMNLEIEDIDFGTFHLYPSSCKSLAPEFV